MTDLEAQFIELVRDTERRVSALPRVESLGSTDDFMRHGVEAMNEVLCLGKLALMLARPNGRAFTRRHAPHIGLLTRLVKLYEGLLSEIVANRRELAELYVRPIIETYTKLIYLLQSGRDSARSFIETSFRAEKEMLEHLNSIRRQRRPLPIERRMRASMKRALRDSGVRESELFERRNWNLDGKTMRDLMQAIDLGLGYAFGFASQSHAAHGTWFDLIRNHLSQEGREYTPDIDFHPSEPRALVPPSWLVGTATRAVLMYFKMDPDRMLIDVLEAALAYLVSLDAAWEKKLE